VLASPRMVVDTLHLALTDRTYRQDWRDPSPLPPGSSPGASPLPARGEGGAGIGALSSTPVPGPVAEGRAQTSRSPSPLAGEGKGEVSHPCEGSRRTSVTSEAGKARKS
jgi:hypothetical protein